MKQVRPRCFERSIDGKTIEKCILRNEKKFHFSRHVMNARRVFKRDLAIDRRKSFVPSCFLIVPSSTFVLTIERRRHCFPSYRNLSILFHRDKKINLWLVVSRKLARSILRSFERMKNQRSLGKTTTWEEFLENLFQR